MGNKIVLSNYSSLMRYTFFIGFNYHLKSNERRDLMSHGYTYIYALHSGLVREFQYTLYVHCAFTNVYSLMYLIEPEVDCHYRARTRPRMAESAKKRRDDARSIVPREKNVGEREREGREGATRQKKVTDIGNRFSRDRPTGGGSCVRVDALTTTLHYARGRSYVMPTA